MIIAIDGPAGSGKSTTAREVARRLGFRHLDSGGFYRAITLAALRAGIPPAEWMGLDADRLDAFDIRARPADHGFAMFLGDEAVSDAIRSDDVNANVSRMSSYPAVRRWVFGKLREVAAGGRIVCDGRDMGTVVFPEARLKVFLTADLRTRALRRLAERGTDRPPPATHTAEMDRLAERDRRDSERDVAPLRQAEDAVALDTSALSFDQQVSRIVEIARARGAGPGTASAGPAARPRS